ncbi:MAG: FAD-dependent monooxygenase [Parachlamydiales bacterium]
MQHIPVLIVGAGPSGLAVALELTRFGIPVRIIDRKATQTLTTNAAGIQTRTIEILEHIGIVKEFLDRGVVTKSLEIHSQKRRLAKVPLDVVDSFHKFILMLPQSDTEHILNHELEKLNVRVERNVEFIELRQENNKVISSLKYLDGKTEIVESDWLVGCDGYNSAVRNHANIKMVGKDFDQEFFVADVRLKSKFDRSSVNMIINKGTLIGIFSLPNDQNDKFRIVGNVGKDQNKDKFTENEIKQIVEGYTEGECEVIEVIWSSPFWIHSKVASKLRNQSVFIAGDAAHVHSPAGAQGMNTGLQDAFNLSWKLALVINNKAQPTILDSYQEERYPIIKNVIKFTEALAFLGLTNNSFLQGIRNFIFRNVTDKVRFIQRKMVGLITQTALKYKNSHIIIKQSNGHSSGPQPGERAPDLVLSENRRLYDYLRNNQHNLLLFTGPAPTTESIESIQDAYHKISDQLGSLIKPYIVSDKKINVPNLIQDNDLALHTRYAVSKPSMCLIRPDQYIGLFMGEVNPSLLGELLQKVGFQPIQ